MSLSEVKTYSPPSEGFVSRMADAFASGWQNFAQGVQQLEKLLGKETAARIVRNGDELFHDQELDAATLHQPKMFLGMWV